MLKTIPSGTLPESVIDAASEWFVRLSAEEATAADHAAWRQWVNASPLHRQAWDRIETLGQQFAQFDRVAGLRALSNLPSQRRRMLLKSLAFTFIAGGSALLLPHMPLRSWIADERTAVGERRQIRLDDGSYLTLNTDSAANIIYNEQQRAIELLQGEIYIATQPDPHTPARPLTVISPAGRIVALGTQFSVFVCDERALVSVGQGQVRLEPTLTASRSMLVPAGMRSFMDSHTAATPSAMPEQQHAWLDGMLYADNMRLDELIATLSRYQRGFLSCDPAVGELRISGAYPLAEIDRTLNAIERILPVKTERRTAYWMRVTAL